jgi:hypothetical protein
MIWGRRNRKEGSEERLEDSTRRERQERERKE